MRIFIIYQPIFIINQSIYLYHLSPYLFLSSINPSIFIINQSIYLSLSSITLSLSSINPSIFIIIQSIYLYHQYIHLSLSSIFIISQSIYPSLSSITLSFFIINQSTYSSLSSIYVSIHLATYFVSNASPGPRTLVPRNVLPELPPARQPHDGALHSGFRMNILPCCVCKINTLIPWEAASEPSQDPWGVFSLHQWRPLRPSKHRFLAVSTSWLDERPLPEGLPSSFSNVSPLPPAVISLRHHCHLPTLDCQITSHLSSPWSHNDTVGGQRNQSQESLVPQRALGSVRPDVTLHDFAQYSCFSSREFFRNYPHIKHI